MIGLSLAYELAGEGLSVRVIDAQQPGHESSWAGAGIMPPAPPQPRSAYEELWLLSNRLHESFARELGEATGIDTGYRQCGSLHFGRRESERSALNSTMSFWQARGIDYQELAPAGVRKLEPQLNVDDAAAYFLPGEFQIRNPRHLQALLAACRQRGVNVEPGRPAESFEQRGRRTAVVTEQGILEAATVCVTSGAWTSKLLEPLGATLAIRPIRGQIALLATDPPLLARIVYEGPHYLVPRDDGKLLVGSTLEDVGFDRSTTDEAIDRLLEFAHDVLPATRELTLERCWAGLRPCSADGLPYMGPLDGFDNLFVAAGHFRSGLQLSPGTAKVMADLVQGRTPLVDLTDFRPNRHSTVHASGMPAAPWLG